MKRKLLCLCLILGILLSFCMTVGAKSFDDTEGHWAEKAIDKWSDKGILNGIGNNNFNPDGLMTRAEAAAVFSRLLALNKHANISDFKDVDSNAWYVESLEKCVSAGILNGDGNNMNPDGYITREMFFVMIARALSIPTEEFSTTNFDDENEVSLWAKLYVNALVNKKYVNGVEGNRIAPKENITRASVITLLDRIIKIYAIEDGTYISNTENGIALVLADNCKVYSGFQGTVVVAKDDISIDLTGTNHADIIIKGDNITVKNASSNTTVVVDSQSENIEVNGNKVESGISFTIITLEEENQTKPIVSPSISHSHNYNSTVTKKPTCTEDGVKTFKCSCGVSYTEPIEKLSENGEHKPGTPVKENEVAGTCKVEGTYDEVVYCSVCGTYEISRTQKTSGYGEHIPGTPVKKNEVAGTCKVEGTYDEVVYCSVCGTHEISRTQKTSGYGEHKPGTPVKENAVDGTCKVEGTYEEVVYCSVCGTHEMSRTSKTGELGDHVPGTPVKENEVAGNCETPATYDEVVYCSVCGTHEVSRTQKTGALGDHTPGTPVKENEVAGNCQTPATYEEVVYCSVCNTHEISRTQKTGALGNHTPGTPVKENEVAGNCQAPATYDEVVYCSVCGTHEISRTQKTGELGNHTPGTSVKENEVAGNCQTPATYDEVVYCSVCGTHEISRTQKTGALGNHTPGTPVKENEVAGTCKVEGTYDEVVYCSVCGTHEISRTQKTSGYGDHVPGTPVKENAVDGTCKVEGTYDEVVYCSVCGTHEISRTQKTTGYGDHEYVSGRCKHCGEVEESTAPQLIVGVATVNEDASTVSVTLSIKNNPGISSLKMSVEYDSSLTLENVAFTQLFGPYVAAPTPYSNPQIINMMSPMSDVTGSGEFATLTFKISEEVNAGDVLEIKLSYDQDNTFNANFASVEFKTVNGSIIVE